MSDTCRVCGERIFLWIHGSDAAGRYPAGWWISQDHWLHRSWGDFGHIAAPVEEALNAD